MFSDSVSRLSTFGPLLVGIFSFTGPLYSDPGESIMCVGNHSDPTDLSLNILAEDRLLKEMKEVDDWWVSVEDGSAESDHGPTDLYSLAKWRYREVRTWKNSEHSILYLVEAVAELGEWHRLPTFHKIRICQELLPYDESSLYPKDQPWILRNLTTQEYVRSEAIAIKPEYIRGPKIRYLGFGEVVLSRICWSTNEESSTQNTHEIHRGVWAGHRFEITTLERHEQDSLGKAEWKDVSEEVANEIDMIWTEEYGSNWRDRYQ